LKRWLIILCLILSSSSLFATLNREDYKKIYKQICTNWKDARELVLQANKVKDGEATKVNELLQRSISYCEQSKESCDTVLNEIAQSSFFLRYFTWRCFAKRSCEREKQSLLSSIRKLNNSIHTNQVIEKALALYKEGQEKAMRASAKESKLSYRISNRDEVVEGLDEVALLYEEAALSISQALDLFPKPMSEKNRALLKEHIERYQKDAKECKKLAEGREEMVLKEKVIVQELEEQLREEITLYKERGLLRIIYETQKERASLLQELVDSQLEDSELLRDELTQLQQAIETFEKEIDIERLRGNRSPPLSDEEIREQEEERKEQFFAYTYLFQPSFFLQNIMHNKVLPLTPILDEKIVENTPHFLLYAEQFYRFCVGHHSPISHLLVEVYHEQEKIYEEWITLPTTNPLDWENYVKEGMIFIPHTSLTSRFGLDLRLHFIRDPNNSYAMVISQRSTSKRYHFHFSINDQKSLLYRCAFVDLPPWQLQELCKPLASGEFNFYPTLPQYKSIKVQKTQNVHHFPVLDAWVEKLNKDPLALAGYVQNEITLSDPFLHEEEGIFYPPGIQRNSYTTFLEGEGSPWEQCQLLAYFLRQAGYSTFYIENSICSLSPSSFEKMTGMRLERQEILLNYPGVLFFDGKEWISLYPWLKEQNRREGYDLYNLMPEAYSSADRWIAAYLKRDERLYKHVGIHGDDRVAPLFVRFVEEELRGQGLSLSDVGIHTKPLKRLFHSWEGFPRPFIKKEGKVVKKHSCQLGSIRIVISSRDNHRHSLIYSSSLQELTDMPLKFLNNTLTAYIEGAPFSLPIDESDPIVDITITYKLPIGNQEFITTHTLALPRGREGVLSFHFGGTSSQTALQRYYRLSKEQDVEKALQALLAFVNAIYFERCSLQEKVLASLHKVHPSTCFSFGLITLEVPHTKHGSTPQIDTHIDMIWIDSKSHPQDPSMDYRQFLQLNRVNTSSNEGQILKEMFKGAHAISTCKLLQLSHIKQQKGGEEGMGFLLLTPIIMQAIENDPKSAQSLYFPNLPNLDLASIYTNLSKEWHAIKEVLNTNASLTPWAYAYLTTFDHEGSYGILILHPEIQEALISHPSFFSHGGSTSSKGNKICLQDLVEFILLPLFPHQSHVGDKLKNGGSEIFTFDNRAPSSCNGSSPVPKLKFSDFFSSSNSAKKNSDVRLEHKSDWHKILDPIDVVTGAFYVDEIDLTLPGLFPLEIRRNYNNQNPIFGEFGWGWKMGLNPHLIEKEGLLYAAETDGTIILYRNNPESGRWEVYPEDNPDLYNLIQKGANPFHAYIENNVLYGADGSKRIFEDGKLQKWIDKRGNSLTFSYDEGELSCIKNSQDFFALFSYNHHHTISEIYTKDGRRMTYHYNGIGELVQVTLPNDAIISYEYDRFHRIIRESKSDGNVVKTSMTKRAGHTHRISTHLCLRTGSRSLWEGNRRDR